MHTYSWLLNCSSNLARHYFRQTYIEKLLKKVSQSSKQPNNLYIYIYIYAHTYILFR